MDTPLRGRLNDTLKTAMKGQDKTVLSTVRLILAAVKDRDIAARGKGNMNGLSDEEILGVLQTMIRQRQEAAEMYEKGNRPELVAQEKGEIAVIEGFLPKQMTDAEMRDAIAGTIAETGAKGMKDMGKAMAALRASYAGRMDFAKASALLREKLAG
jgi:uncharacterized protein YqeY